MTEITREAESFLPFPFVKDLETFPLKQNSNPMQKGLNTMKNPWMSPLLIGMCLMKIMAQAKRWSLSTF